MKRLGAGADGQKPLAPATVGVVHGLVSSVFKAAVRDRRIMANPCEGTRLPKPERVKVVPPTTEQVEHLRDSLPDPSLRAVVTFTAGTGLRQGEVFGLTVDRLNMLRREVTVDRQLVKLPDQPARLGPPKTTASVRTVPLPQVVVDALAAHLAEFPPGPDGLVFTLERRAGQPAGVRPDLAPGCAGLPASQTARACTCCGTTTRHCSSGTGRASRRSRPGSGTPLRPRRWTPTATCGRTRTIARGRPSTRNSALDSRVSADSLRTGAGPSAHIRRSTHV